MMLQTWQCIYWFYEQQCHNSTQHHNINIILDIHKVTYLDTVTYIEPVY